MKKHLPLLLTLLLSFTLNAQEVIEEANVEFELPDQWSLLQKAGTFEDGLVQYFYQREPIPTPEGMEAYPAVIFILDKANNRDFMEFVMNDVQQEKNGRMSAGEFQPIRDVLLGDFEGKVVEIKINDSGYRLRALIYYFSNNDIFVKMITNTIRDENPATAELDSIIKSLKTN